MTDPAPLLVHIGHQRTLTTWLQKQVFSRPENGFVLVGGGFPGDHKSRIAAEMFPDHPLALTPDALRARLEPQIQAAQAAGSVPVVSNERLSGSPAFGCSDCQTIAAALDRAFPEARFVIGIREQDGMLFSHYLRYVQGGGRLPLKAYFHHKPMKAVGVPRFVPEVFSYELIVEHYRERFGADRVLVQPLELFKHDHKLYLERLFRIAGLAAPDSLPVEREENRNHPAAAILWKRLLNPLLYPDGVGGKARPGLHRVIHLLGMLDRNMPAGLEARARRRLRAQVREMIGDTYRTGNRRLSEITGLDLSALGYRL